MYYGRRKSVDGTLHRHILITRNVNICGGAANKSSSLMIDIPGTIPREN